MVKMHKKNGLKLLVWYLKLGCQYFHAQNRSNDTVEPNQASLPVVAPTPASPQLAAPKLACQLALPRFNVVPDTFTSDDPGTTCGSITSFNGTLYAAIYRPGMQSSCLRSILKFYIEKQEQD
jgi:hypothetical protein